MSEDQNTSILVSHQARIKCYLNKFKSQFPEEKIHRFMNGCILKLTREVGTTRQATTSRNDNAWTESMELVYDGEIGEKKPDYVYYSTKGSEKSTDVNGQYQIIKFPTLERSLTEKETTKHDPNKTYVFYIIRHGQAEHNVWGTEHNVLRRTIEKISKQVSSKNRDTNLTMNEIRSSGQKQAQKAGQSLYNLLKTENNKSFPSSHNLTLFVSDLKRTRQTLQHILYGIKLQNIELDKTINVNVLPCSHELAYEYDEEGDCDGVKSITPVENTMNCTMCGESVCKDTKLCNKLTLGNINIHFNWDNYQTFYQGTRTKPGKRKHCKDTDMITYAISEFLAPKIHFAECNSDDDCTLDKPECDMKNGICVQKFSGGKKRKTKRKSRKTKRKSRKGRKSRKSRK
jgi:broad specificity phosphatase PhoE